MRQPIYTMKNTILFDSFSDVRERMSYRMCNYIYPPTKGGGWACAFRRKGMPLHALAGRGLPMCDLQGAHGKTSEGHSPRNTARSTATRVTLK